MNIRKIFSIIVLSLFLVGLLVFSKPVRADTPPECNITGPNFGSNVVIPASCEGKDVVLDGNITVKADLIKINQSTGEECIRADEPLCDTKRHFNSLTIQGGAILTHNGINGTDMTTEDTSSYGAGSSKNNSLADNTIGYNRWKKVDIIITDGLNINTNGQINVDGKGYDGSYARTDSNCNSDVYWPGVGYASGGEMYGWGPGGGWHNQNTPWTSGGGGGYGGEGHYGWTRDCLGWGNCFSVPVEFGSSEYNYLFAENRFEWGSGGGGGSRVDGRNVTSISGGGGGGRIIIDAREILIDSSGFITANGQNAYFRRAPNPCNDNNPVGGGGGSGGFISLQSESITTVAGNPISVLGGGQGIPEPGGIGQLLINNGQPGDFYNISAEGGNGYRIAREAYGVPAGGGGGWIVVGVSDGQITPPQQGKVKVIVTWKELGQEQTVEMFTWLRDVRVQ